MALTAPVATMGLSLTFLAKIGGNDLSNPILKNVRDAADPNERRARIASLMVAMATA
jgi:hypothetical protein